jgi:hypothetical protein
VRRFPAVLSLAVGSALALGATPLVADAAVSPASGLSAFTVNGNTGSYLLGSGHLSFTGAAVQESASGAEGLSFSGSSASGYGNARVAAPTGGALSTGTFATQRFEDASTWGLDIDANSAGCNESTGWITVYEVGPKDGTGNVTSFAASYSFSCDGSAPVTGQLRWSSGVDYMAFPDTALGKSSATQTLTVTAAAAATLGTTTVTGGNANQFQVTGDSCKGATVAAGGTCTVTVAGTPSAPGPQQATVTVPDATNGDHVVTLDVTGVATPVGGYTRLKPARLLDTRSGLGAPKAMLGTGKTLNLQVTGRGGVAKTAVSAVVLNLTVTGPTAGGYLTAYPTGQARPGTSSINFPRGWTGANLITVPVGTNGQVSIYNAKGATNVIADVMGFYRSETAANTPGSYGSYFLQEPARVLDTRDGSLGGPLPGGYYVRIPIGFSAEDNAHITAFAVNVTVTKPVKGGYVSAFDGNEANISKTSVLNFLPGRTVTNMAVVPTSPCYDCTTSGIPQIAILNGSPGNIDVIVDLVGVYDDGTYDGLRFRPLKPTRIVDTRRSLGTTRLGYKATKTVTAPASVAGVDTYALVTNTTGILPTAGTFLTLWAHDGTTLPTVSNLNLATGEIVSNMTMTGVGAGNTFNIFNRNGNIDVAVDVTGSMEMYPPSPTGVATAQRSAALRPSRAPMTTLTPRAQRSTLHRVG